MEVHASAAMVVAVLKAEMPNAKENPAAFVVGKIMVMILFLREFNI